MNIETGEIMEGDLPRRALGLVREWHGIHKGERLENWRLVEGRKVLKKIAPLE